MSRASRIVEALDKLCTKGTIASFVRMGPNWLVLLNDNRELYFDNDEALAFVQGAQAEAART